MGENKLIITSGYFNPIHVGHIEYLELAKSLGGDLIVIVNNDKQAILKHGKSFMNEKERMKIVGALRCVDEVVLSIDEDPSVCETITQIWRKCGNRKVIFAKGGDRMSSNIPEFDVCRKLDIEIVDKLGDKIQSSSNLIKKYEDHN